MKHLISPTIILCALVSTYLLWPAEVPDADDSIPKPYILVTSFKYGAIADDGLDDRKAIQAAINEALKGPRRTVFFPEGTFNVSAPLVITGKSGVHIQGSTGWNERVEAHTSVTRILLDKFPE